MKETKSMDNTPLVLVVDDSASIRSSTQRLVRSFGFRTGAFASGEEMLKSKLAGESSCVILDLRMPHLNGLEVQDKLAVMHPDLPVVFLTAHWNEEERKQAMKAGAIAFLQKPASRTTLLDAIREGIRRKSSLQADTEKPNRGPSTASTNTGG
jgi:FixJ family two-component response regulator